MKLEGCSFHTQKTPVRRRAFTHDGRSIRFKMSPDSGGKVTRPDSGAMSPGIRTWSHRTRALSSGSARMRALSPNVYLTSPRSKSLSHGTQATRAKMSKNPEKEQVIYFQRDRPWTWKPLQPAYRQRNSSLKSRLSKMVDTKRSEAVLRNLSHELLTPEECLQFKQALHHFRVSNSVPSLCQQLKSIINNTPKLLLLVELSYRMPKALQEDFHRLCTLQFPNYETYLTLFVNGNSHISKIIPQESGTGKFKIVANGIEKKMMMRYNNQKQGYELRSHPGTSVTSGVYSNGSDSDNADSVFDDAEGRTVHTSGRATPVHIQGKENVHKVFLNRHGDGSLGLGITGGKEFGSEITINVVEEGGPAATQGLHIGDKILEVNGHNFNNITHAEAVLVMRNAWNLIILVERPAWQQALDNEDVADMVSRQHEIQDLDIPVFPAAGGRLGCISQRLPTKDLIVKSVDENSPASKAGVQVHDLIYKIDGVSVRELSEKQIVMLINAKRINLRIKRYQPLSENGLNGSTPEQRRSRSATPVMFHRQTTPENHVISSSHSRKSREDSTDSQPSNHIPYEITPSFQTTQFITVPSEKTRPPSGSRRISSKDEQAIFSLRSTQEPNWIISPKGKEHASRFRQRRDLIGSAKYSIPRHIRSRSQEPHKAHYVTASQEVHSRGVSKYIRNRSTSPHRNSIARVHHEDNVIRAIQFGLEKRNRAVRLSQYQMADPADYEWEI
ncbi:uncharacterized protein LOC127832267 isoform X2 [Dreissena polymorpha]|uniref:PDZ domain-containing protein n=2 Tax=Dreissena polymorpha TaxID=45954 RepID=A0A9D4GGH8_DREPO|nr:uncharacterized protein LOC127832267 isoform X2 [Dreissena polymorpha]XP_052213608.1 uncharacterized protein LOC127832267 isoform X2 [Dreissena polymorpha]KAH3816353.1 hypothetical protein DPMN_117869 [Dreissena polymorpha]